VKESPMTMDGFAFTRRSMLGGAGVLAAMPALAVIQRPPLYDAHLHFFTNDIAHYPIDPRNAREPEAVMRGRVMDDPGTPAKMFPLWAAEGVVGGTGVQYSGAYKTDNSYVLDLADKFPAKIHPEIIVNGRDPESPARVAQLASTRRVRALRLTGFGDGAETFPWLDSAPVHDVWAVAGRMGLPVGITFLPPKATEASLAAIRALAIRYPRTTIILEHFGWLAGTPRDTSLLPGHLALAELRNVHFKFTTNNIDELTAQGRATAPFLRHAVDVFGADRLMWGSDAGNTLRPYPGMVADAVAATAALTTVERRRVLHDNGQAMFAGKGRV
jgi:predicted TIM-barrel fold metal-dependent hydrolase